jgi:hypothetical protein
MSVVFGTSTVQQAEGYFIVKSKTPVRTGDQVQIDGKKFSVIDVKDNWIWNKLANIIIAIR